MSYVWSRISDGLIVGAAIFLQSKTGGNQHPPTMAALDLEAILEMGFEQALPCLLQLNSHLSPGIFDGLISPPSTSTKDLHHLLSLFPESTTCPATSRNEDGCSVNLYEYIHSLIASKSSPASPTDCHLPYLKDWHCVRELELAGNPTPLYQLPWPLAVDWLNTYCDWRRANAQDDYRFVYLGHDGTATRLHSDVMASFSW